MRVKLAHPRYISGHRNIIWYRLDFLFRAEEASFDLGIASEITLFNLVQLPRIFKFGSSPKWILR